jgi:hypothetical protein
LNPGDPGTGSATDVKLMQPTLMFTPEGLKVEIATLSSLLAFIPPKSEKGICATW